MREFNQDLVDIAIYYKNNRHEIFQNNGVEIPT